LRPVRRPGRDLGGIPVDRPTGTRGASGAPELPLSPPRVRRSKQTSRTDKIPSIPGFGYLRGPAKRQSADRSTCRLGSCGCR
jgi:hypothetical protein